MTSDNEYMIRSDCGEIFVRDLGQGGKYPLVIAHGGPDWDHSYLLPAARLIAEQRRVLLFDLRGCGRSEKCKNLRDYTINTASNDLLAVLCHLGVSAHVLGFTKDSCNY